MTTRDYQKRSPVAIFFAYFKPHKKLFIFDMVCAFTIAIIDLTFPFITRWSLYDLLPNNDYNTFFIAMTCVALAFFLRAVLTYVVAFWGHTFGILVEADIRSDLFRHMQSLSFGYFDKNRTGQLMSRLTSDLFDITELAHHGPEDVLISAVTITGALVMMFTIQWQLALVIAVMIPLFLTVVWKRRREMAAASSQVKKKIATISTDIESGISGIRTTKAFASEGAEIQKFESANDSFKTSKKQFHKAMGRFIGTMEFFLCTLPLAVIAVGGYLVMEGQMQTIDIIVFNMYVATFITPMRKLATFAELFANGSAGFLRFVELMGTEPSLQDAPDAATMDNVKGNITVDDVHFAYQNETVLHGISLDIPKGETIAVVGPSGGGKSTLCQLIPRFYDVTSGAISIDGQDIRTVTQQSLRRNIGIVQQDVFLFAGSVLENIRYGRPDATVEEVIEAAKMAEIYNDICGMPQGFDTYVGERGVMLSGGQKQRISIARIFLKNPPILILDEATSALDTVTEHRIQETFEKLTQGRTCLIIAHRLSTVRHANRIVVVENGLIVEQGSHEELLSQDGAYAALVATQKLTNG
ncbi:ABC transporter ATP-binding protein [Bengtsoniella intestinalis]|uniref:ABC transporter ATP-binding protein n=1 Tax=Bengtsoniella intestinalis TaxID=3073143 RepID=UPI00391F8155